MGIEVSSASDVRDRLRDGMLWTLAEAGSSGISARLLAKRAGASPSAINYHFGGIEQLFADAQAEAVRRAARWLDGRLAPLARARPMPAGALAPLLATTIADWSREAPELAFAWRECQLAAQRQAAVAPLAESWTDVWRRFWQDIGIVFRLDDVAVETLAIFFDGESFLHLIDWDRGVDPAASMEICARFVNRLSGRSGAAPAWRHLARQAAARDLDLTAALSPVAAEISQAILTLVGERGVAALTHRAVALQAGVTLGAVSYHFPSRAALLHGAFLAAYHNVTQPRGGGGHENEILPLESFCDRVVKTVIAPGPRLANIRAIDEILLAGARDPELKPTAAYLRYSRGETTIQSLRRLPGFEDVDALDSAIVSGCIGGIRRSLCARPLDEQTRRARDGIGELLGFFQAAGRSGVPARTGG